MTNQNLTEIRARCEAAHANPQGRGTPISDIYALMANAREDIRVLIEYSDQLTSTCAEITKDNTRLKDLNSTLIDGLTSFISAIKTPIEEFVNYNERNLDVQRTES